MKIHRRSDVPTVYVDVATLEEQGRMHFCADYVKYTLFSIKSFGSTFL